MLNDILNAFRTPSPEKLHVEDAKVALAALMVRLAKTDGDYSALELATIERVLADHYDLDAAQTIALRLQAEELESKAPDDVRFTRVIKQSVPYEERSDVVQALWVIVLADGQRSDDENVFMRLVSSLLGVNDRDSAFARQAAIKSQQA